MSPLFQSIRNHSVLLGVFALTTALILGIVKTATEDNIALQQQLAERRALDQVLPPTNHDNDLLQASFEIKVGDSQFSQIELLALTETRLAYVAKLNKQVTGFIIPVEAHDGYSGDITLLVGINADASLSGIRVLTHKETPGLGDKIDLRVSDWILNFENKSLNNPQTEQWQVKKDGGQFDQFVGATITPRAVVAAVKNTLLFFEANQHTLDQLASIISSQAASTLDEKIL